MNKPLVSIIIPCFNGQEYISQTIESALDQSYNNVEIIVIDDGSKDRSWKIISGFDSIKKIRQGNLGACAARNRGLKASSGKYIKFLDSDDFLYKDCLASQVRNSTSLERKMIIYGWHRVYMQSDNRSAKRKIEILPGLSQPVGLVLKNLPISLPLYPRDALLAVNGFDEQLRSRQEWSLNIRLSIAGYHFSYADDLTFCQRIHSSENRISSRWLDCDEELENLKSIYKSVQQNNISGFRAAWAWKFWNQGRQFLKRGDETSANRFFEEAKKMSPMQYKHYWPKVYRISTSIFGYKIPEIVKSKLT
ncbi:MAG: glycosyltransferase family A protein [Pseudomonadota bacterium]|nr:glycosyltransferase family A protein [Pseudomonadota bacterium]